MKRITIIIVILVAIIILIGIFFINFNKEKTPISAEEFYNFMQQKGYSLTDANSQFEDYDYIKKVYIAANSDYKYQIEFYEFTDDFYATSFYNNNKSIFESTKENTSAETSISLKNYSKYTLLSNDKYMVVSKINNTALYINVDDEYKDIGKSILDELGY